MKRLGSARSSDGDSVLAREYVVVDKGPIEVNALADGSSLNFARLSKAECVLRQTELAAQTMRPNAIARVSSRGFLSKPLSSGQPATPPVTTPPQSTTPAPYPPQTPTHDLAGTPPFALTAHGKSVGHGSSPRSRHSYIGSARSDLTAPRSASYTNSPLAAVVGSPTNAIAKAINISLKLFGNPADGLLMRRPSATKRKPIPRFAEALDPAEVSSNLQGSIWKLTAAPRPN